MPHQNGFGDNGPEATGSSKPDDSHDRMQKKSENVAHAPDRIKLQKPHNSIGLWNSPTTPHGRTHSRVGGILRVVRSEDWNHAAFGGCKPRKLRQYAGQLVADSLCYGHVLDGLRYIHYNFASGL